MDSEPFDERALGRLKWSCRRGLLENDLIIGRFFERHGERLNRRQAEALTGLMALSDNDLLDLLLGRKEPQGDLDAPDVHALLGLMRARPAI